MNVHRDDPIVAIATPAGRGGIGVVRVSFGAWSRTPRVAAFVAALVGRVSFEPRPRETVMVAVREGGGAAIDRGLALFFESPRSYTGEDVVELQMHGGPTALQMIVSRCLEVARTLDGDEGPAASMRLAAPGEFTERAFLAGKLDLAQAEAVADLIEASSEAAVLGAQASLSGAFSREVGGLVDRVIALRALVEATLDFPDEEIDFLEASDARGRLASIASGLQTLLARAREGARLREGTTVVLAGRPNVGKSSLLNALARDEVAIVTPIAGTTRDRVEATVHLDGVAIRLVDTAGIRALADAGDEVERIGIERTWDAIGKAQAIVHCIDPTAGTVRDPVRGEDEAIAARLPTRAARIALVNKIDLTDEAPRVSHERDGRWRVYASARTGAGLDGLRDLLRSIAGGRPAAEGGFLARERHVEALRRADRHVAEAIAHAGQGDRALELVAEELRLAQLALDAITGAFTADDLLGEIFGKFCIGK